MAAKHFSNVSAAVSIAASSLTCAAADMEPLAAAFFKISRPTKYASKASLVKFVGVVLLAEPTSRLAQLTDAPKLTSLRTSINPSAFVSLYPLANAARPDLARISRSV